MRVRINLAVIVLLVILALSFFTPVINVKADKETAVEDAENFLAKIGATGIGKLDETFQTHGCWIGQ